MTADRYIQWCEALTDFYICNNDSTILFVNSEIIEEIGGKYNIEIEEDDDYVEHFIQSISYFLEKGRNAGAHQVGRVNCKNVRQKFFNLLHIDNHLTKMRKDTIICENFGKNNSTLIDFALFLSNHLILKDLRSKQPLYYPYFPYIIYVLLVFNLGESQQWSSIESQFRSNNIYFSQNDRSKIASLFQALIRDGVITKDCTITNDEHIKYLKYHSVLKPSALKLFRDILYDYHIRWREGMSYNDLRAWIWRVGIRDIQSHRSIREALLDPNSQPYFESIIRSFDPDKYRTSQRSNIGEESVKRKKGRFRFVVRLDYGACYTEIWADGIRPNISLISNDPIFTITPEVVYDNCVSVHSNITWDEYSVGLNYNDSDYQVASRGSDLFYFQVVDGNFIQCLDPEYEAVGKKLYLVVKKEAELERNDIIEALGAKLVDHRVIPFFGENWLTYVIENYYPQVEDESVISAQNATCYASVDLDSSVKFPNHQYHSEAFPYILCEGIAPHDVEVIIRSPGIEGEINFKQKNVGNKIFLYDIQRVDTGEIEVFLEDKEKNGLKSFNKTRSFKLLYNDHIIPHTNKNYAKYDRWGCYISAEQDFEEPYYSNNKVYPAIKDGGKLSHGYHLEYGDKRPYNFFISLLFAIGEQIKIGEEYCFTKDVLNNLFTYTASFRGDILSDTDLKELRIALCDIGLISHYYDNSKKKQIFQVNGARLIPLNKTVLDINGSQIKLYLLYGTYSKNDYTKLINSAIYIKYQDVAYDKALNDYIPPFIILGFTEENLIGDIEIASTTIMRELVSFVGKIKDLEGDKVFKDNLIRTHRDVEANKEFPYLEKTNNEYGAGWQIRLSTGTIMNNPNLSSAIMRNYTKYKKGKHIWIRVKKHNQDQIYFRYDWDIPFFIRKALVASSLSLAKRRFVFSVDNKIRGDERNLFEVLNHYSTDELDSFLKSNLKNALGGENAQELVFSAQSVLNMYAYKSIIEGFTWWQIGLTDRNNRLVCYSHFDNDKMNYTIFYRDRENIWKEVISDNKGNKSMNAKISSVIKLHYERGDHFGELSQWYENYFILSSTQSSIDPIKNNEATEEVVILLQEIQHYEKEL